MAISKFSNSEIGSSHWSSTLLSYIIRVGEYLKEHGSTDSPHYSSWGEGISERSKEINDYFIILNDSEKEIESYVEKFVEDREKELDKKALEYATNHSSAPDKQTPDWIITDFKAGANWAFKEMQMP